MRAIFDESTIFVGGSRMFDVMVDGAMGEPIRITYDDVKSAKIYKGTELEDEYGDVDLDAEYLRLELEDGSTATFDNSNVRLYHV